MKGIGACRMAMRTISASERSSWALDQTTKPNRGVRTTCMPTSDGNLLRPSQQTPALAQNSQWLPRRVHDRGLETWEPLQTSECHTAKPEHHTQFC